MAHNPRKNQRYTEAGHRQLVGCVPFRYQNDSLEILMITNQKGKEWILPKGGWENDESALDGQYLSIFRITTSAYMRKNLMILLIFVF